MGRALLIGDDSELKIKQNLRINNFEHVIEAFDLGEVSFHSGWIFHRAGANQTDQIEQDLSVTRGMFKIMRDSMWPIKIKL